MRAREHLCTRVSECACPGGGQADCWHSVKQSQWDAFKGAGESPLVKITQSGANEHGSANRGTCQEITQPFWKHSQRFNSGPIALRELRPPSGFFPVLLRRLSYLHLELRSAAVMLRREESVEVRLASPEAVILRFDELFALRTLPRLHLPHLSAFALFCYWSHAWSKS